MTQQTNDTAAIMTSLAEMRGENKAQFQSLFKLLDLVREDIKQVEARSEARIKHLEDHINTKLLVVDSRLNNLEAEDKIHIKQIATNSALGGGIAGALVTAAVEIIKHIK